MMKSRLMLGLAILVWSLLGGVDVAQRRTAPAAVTAQVSDGLVFGDREWIHYLAAGSSTPRRLAKGNFPALSPDRRRVAYCAPTNTAVSAPASGALMLFDLASGKTATLFRSAAWCADPRWSANGERISFTLALASGTRELHLIAPDGGSNQKLITGGDQAADDIFNPSWAPDGESLYFQDMTNLVQLSTSGRLMAKTPLGTIVGDRETVTSSDSFVPSPNDPNLFAYTRSVPG